MQSTKDSFYVALRDRLAARAPERTISLFGAERPAVLVAADAPSVPASPPDDCFLLSFGEAAPVAGFDPQRPPWRMRCTVRYATRGAEPGAALDRALTALDAALLAIVSPPTTAKLDHTATPPRDLGSRILWTAPRLADAEAQGLALVRTAHLDIFFYPETPHE